MGLFDSISSGISNIASKAVKGIKKTAKTVKKGIKSQFNQRNLKGFKRGFGMAGRALQAPQKFIEKNDPLAKQMGDFGGLSPITLGSAIALGIPTSVGYLEELAVDSDKQRKIRSGDADEIMNLGFAGLGLLPVGSAGKVLKRGKKAGKGLVKGAMKALK